MKTFDPAAHGWRQKDDTGFSAIVGPIWEREESGGVRYGMLTHAMHVNSNGVVHGGVIATLADSALAYASRRASGGRRQATIQLDVHYVDSGHIGEFLEVEAIVTRTTRSVAFVTGRISAGDRLVATAQGVWRLFERRAESGD